MHFVAPAVDVADLPCVGYFFHIKQYFTSTTPAALLTLTPAWREEVEPTSFDRWREKQEKEKQLLMLCGKLQICQITKSLNMERVSCI